MESNSQVAILARLATKEGDFAGQDICVATTHLKAKPGHEEKRLHQGRLLLKAVADFLAGREVPVFVMGDFNDTPDSPVCNYFKRSTPTTTTTTTTDGEAPPEVATSSHPFELKSAYTFYDASETEPFTTYKKREREVIRPIDYIWFTPSEGRLRVTPTSLLEIPSLEMLPNRLPASDYPSDHLAIAARFVISREW